MILGSVAKLNLIPGSLRPIVHVNETDSGCELHFRIYNGTMPYNVPEGITATIRGTKGDGNGYAAEVTTQTGSNLVVVTLTEQMTAVAGIQNIFEIVFADSNGLRVGTANFVLAVEKAALNSDTVISDSDIAYAEQVLNELQSVSAVNTQVQQNKADIASEISTRQSETSSLRSDLSSETSTRASADALLQNEIDQIIAPSGEAPSAAEVQNARIGADGVTYSTLGDAIRTNDSQLRSQLEAITGDSYNVVETLAPTFTADRCINASGNSVYASGYKIASYTPLTPGATLDVQISSVSEEYPIFGITYAFYSSGGVSESNLVGTTHVHSFSGILKVPENATTLAVVQTTGNTTNYVKLLETKTDDLQYQIDGIDDAIDQKLPYIQRISTAGETVETSINFDTVGLLNSRDGSVTPSETAYATSGFIPLNDIVGIYRTGTTIRFTLWRYAFYDNRKRFLGIVADTMDYTIVNYNGKQVTWLDLTAYPSATYVRISRDTSRPYTYHTVYHGFSYDIPHVSIKGIEPLKFYGKTIVNFGDSLFGNYRDTNATTDKSISKMIADATGATVYNCGFGGCRMSYHSQYWRAFSMYALADAISTNTWTDQDAAIAASPSGMPSYFAETLALLKSIDFTNVDYITIGYGTNDYTGDIFIDARSGLEEYQYFKGALEYSLRKILTTFPHIRIAVISPTWRWFLSDGVYAYSSDDAESVNTRGLYLYDYVNACKEVCEKVHVAYIDTYYTLGFNEYTHLEYFPSNDGTHPNQSGRQLRTDRIVGQLEALY